jgi:hypothetical protein
MRAEHIKPKYQLTLGMYLCRPIITT